MVLARGDGTATSAVGLVRELGTATSAEDWERGRGTKISQVRFISKLINPNSHLSFIQVVSGREPGTVIFLEV